MAEEKENLSTGLDIGTNTIIAARMDDEGKPLFKVQRDAFFEIKPVTAVNALTVEKSLKTEDRQYIKRDKSFFVVGEDAINIAIKRGANTRRPLSRGVISPSEKEAHPMIKLIIQSVIGKARRKNEPCFYSVPADPVEGEFDIVFHNGFMEGFLGGLGYEATPILEAEAVMFSELLEEGLTGMALSFGAGMVNCCIMSEGETLVAFSIPKSGDWVDHSVANTDIDLTDSLVQQSKEAGISLIDPKDKVEQAISIYYDYLLQYIVKMINFVLEDNRKVKILRDPIKIVLAGGSTLINGFLEKYKVALEKENFVLPVDDVFYAEDRMHAVAKGCLMAALI